MGSCRKKTVFSAGLVLAAMTLAVSARAQVDEDVEVAEDLLVELDASELELGPGPEFWENLAPETIGDFQILGDPQVVERDGVIAVSFNEDGRSGDSYESIDEAPEGILGPDPSRSIEIWVWNETIATEETLVAWGKRGGPDGSNMSFNYGSHGSYGAVGHWGGNGPDLGWNNAGGAPEAGLWHHLVYTYDGETTRVYTNGCLDMAVCELSNEEFLGFGRINTHPGKIKVAQQTEGDGFGLTLGLQGSLAVARLRIHDGVLSDEQVLNNFEAECEEFCPGPSAPVFTNTPKESRYFSGQQAYVFRLAVEARPPAEFEVISPPGGTIDEAGRFEYPIPNPEPESFDVEILAVNEAGEDSATWTVNREVLEAGDIEVAEELLVNLDARDPTAGEEFWENHGTMDDFQMLGAPVVEQRDFGVGVSFNENGRSGDTYESIEDAPPGILGPDPSRSIEIWVWNEEIPNEETLVAWGRRGGPDGSNMSFNYGSHNLFGAVGHWGGNGPDLGWNNVGGAPEVATWHHLVYTYDGETTRVYSDGCIDTVVCEMSNEEFLGLGRINTHPGKIKIAQQTEGDGFGLTLGLQGSILVGKLRIHDGVLSPEQIEHNYETELPEFSPGPCPEEGDPGYADTHLTDVTILSTGFGLGASHRATAEGVDDSGDQVLYTFRVEAQIDGVAERVIGPQTSGTALLFLRTAGSYRVTVSVQDRDDCDDFAEDAISRSVIIVGDEIPPEDCGNGWDDDADGDTDCDDADCAATAACDAVPRELCDNGRDDDGDGAIDCAATDCPACPELCDNGADDDGDGAVDCDDDDCADSAACKVPAGPLFVRGDGNSDGSINLTDGVIPLLYLFSGGDAPVCFDAADTNDTGNIEITDAIIIFSWLFSGGAPPASPTPSSAGYLQEDCGVDETEDGADCLRVSPICN